MSMTTPIAGRGLAYQALRLKAMAWLVFGRQVEAAAVFDRMLVLWPLDPYALASRSHQKAQAGRLDEAIVDSQALVGAWPQRSAADWFNLAYLLEQRNRLEEAEAAFRRALTLDEKLDRAWYGLGLVLIRMARFEDAIARKTTIRHQGMPIFIRQQVKTCFKTSTSKVNVQFSIFNRGSTYFASQFVKNHGLTFFHRETQAACRGNLPNGFSGLRQKMIITYAHHFGARGIYFIKINIGWRPQNLYPTSPNQSVFWARYRFCAIIPSYLYRPAYLSGRQIRERIRWYGYGCIIGHCF